MQRRNHVPSWRELFERGYVADTIEVSAGWSAIGKVYADVVAALSAVPNVINASAHSSHAYRTGLNLYFSFAAAHADPAERERAYLECWRRAMEATARHGAASPTTTALGVCASPIWSMISAPAAFHCCAGSSRRSIRKAS